MSRDEDFAGSTHESHTVYRRHTPTPRDPVAVDVYRYPSGTVFAILPGAAYIAADGRSAMAMAQSVSNRVADDYGRRLFVWLGPGLETRFVLQIGDELNTSFPGDFTKFSRISGVELSIDGWFSLPWRADGDPAWSTTELKSLRVLRGSDRLPIGTVTAVSFPTKGPTAGCIVLDVDKDAKLAATVGYDFDVVELDGTILHHSIPLFDSGLERFKALQLCVDPCDASRTDRNYVRTATSEPIESRYHTRFGRSVELTAVEGMGRLDLASERNGLLCFQPAGKFALSSDIAHGERLELSVGLGDDEWVSLPADDSNLHFVGASPSRLRRMTDGHLEPDAAGDGPRMPWVRPPKDSLWIEQSSEAPIYGAIRHERAWPGDFAVLAAQPTIDVQLDGEVSFPVLPVAGSAMSNYSFAQDAETHYARPIRRNTHVDSPKLMRNSLGLKSGAGVTASGQVVQFEGGRIVRIDLGRATAGADTSIALSFGTATERLELPDYVCEAFLGERFLVATRMPTDARFDASVKIGGWSFECALRRKSEDMLAPPALIVKSTPGTLRDLIADVRRWTAYRVFNDSDQDGDGLLLSHRLLAYMDAAKALQDSGVPGLNGLLAALDDPEWRGFIFIRSPLSGSAAAGPEGAEFLTSAISSGVIRPEAHHLACSVGTVTTNTSATGIDARTTFFGLLHYSEDATSTAPANAALRVQELSMVVANSTLVDFHCRVGLEARRLFGRSVRADGAGTVFFRGALRHGDDGPHMAFAADLSSNRQIVLGNCPISRVEVNEARIVHQAKDTLVCLSGSFSTLRASAGDFLSFEAIPFHNLILRVAPNLAGTWDASSLTLQTDPILALGDADSAPPSRDAVLVRPMSLAAGFSLSPRRVICGSGDAGPSEQDFSPVSTSPATGGWTKGKSWFGLLTRAVIADSPELALDLLFAWTADDNPPPSSPMSVWLALDVAGAGHGFAFDIDGVAKVGVQTLHLFFADGTYGLELGDLGVSIMGLTFPPKGSTTAVIASVLTGDGEPSLGWFARYRRGA